MTLNMIMMVITQSSITQITTPVARGAITKSGSIAVHGGKAIDNTTLLHHPMIILRA